jgi:hypothetical protein
MSQFAIACSVATWVRRQPCHDHDIGAEQLCAPGCGPCPKGLLSRLGRSVVPKFLNDGDDIHRFADRRLHNMTSIRRVAPASGMGRPILQRKLRILGLTAAGVARA